MARKTRSTPSIQLAANSTASSVNRTASPPLTHKFLRRGLKSCMSRSFTAVDGRFGRRGSRSEKRLQKLKPPPSNVGEFRTGHKRHQCFDLINVPEAVECYDGLVSLATKVL